MVKRADIVGFARSWDGVRWQHQGRTKRGIDCAGLVDLIGEHFHLFVEPPIRNYPHRPDGTFIGHFRKHMIEKQVKDAKDGDVLIFSEGVHTCHSGVCATKHGQPSVIHAHKMRGKVIEESLKQAESVVKPPVFCFAFHGIED